jgi:hypothetical protein
MQRLLREATAIICVRLTGKSGKSRTIHGLPSRDLRSLNLRPIRHLQRKARIGRSAWSPLPR